jgi:NAD(P)-dependent dehydrogenase (short-subunit alcohol dehydrogenase family)
VKDTADTADKVGGVIVVFGGRSEIGTELAVRLAPGATVVLAARGPDRLAEQVAAVRAAGAQAVHTVAFDADDVAAHAALVDAIVAEHGLIGTDLARSLVAAVGLRNILVHEYARADLSIVAAAVPTAQRDLADFVRQVASWLQHRR